MHHDVDTLRRIEEEEGRRETSETRLKGWDAFLLFFFGLLPYLAFSPASKFFVRRIALAALESGRLDRIRPEPYE